MMMLQDPEIEPFSKFIEALDPWLEQVVCSLEDGRIVCIASILAQENSNTFH